MNAQRKNELRMLLAIVLTLATLMMGYVAMTVPVFAMTGPAIVTIALAVAAYFTWRSPAKPPEKTVRVAGRDLKDHS